MKVWLSSYEAHIGKFPTFTVTGQYYIVSEGDEKWYTGDLIGTLDDRPGDHMLEMKTQLKKAILDYLKSFETRPKSIIGFQLKRVFEGYRSKQEYFKWKVYK